jgi:S1-C subfamily serine protease
MKLDELRRSIVRVNDGSGNGTGFVVGPDTVLTCHHVIGDGKDITVVAGSERHLVNEVTLPPFRAGRPIFDLALLHVAVPGAPAVVLDDSDPEPGDDLQAFGFTDKYPEGDSALFVFEGPSVEREERLLRLKSAQARPGLSGAPLLSGRTGKVVGVVSRTRNRDSDLGARAVPIALAFRLQPALAPGVPSRSADNDDSHLTRLVAIHERNVQVLEAQVAGYGPLNVPPYKQNELDHERTELARLRSQLGGS